MRNPKKTNEHKIKHSIFDKIIFILLTIAMLVTFVWDILKDFIPDEYWELKLLVMIVGALSGFFTVMSFVWDKKFSNVANEIVVAHDGKFDSIFDKIDVFTNEKIRYYDSFNDAILPIVKSKSEFEEVKIFAYSAKNYIEYLLRSSIKIKIKHMQLCLRRANDYSAWFVCNEKLVNKYKSELEKVLEGLDSLKTKGQVSSYEVRFYDFESYSHFGIFDNQILLGDLIPCFDGEKTVNIGQICTMINVGNNSSLFSSKAAFFDSLFRDSVTDSGLKLFRSECRYCNTSRLLQNPRYVQGGSSLGKCDISLIDDTETIKDFLLEPDFHPISELHMLLVCKFHILNLYDYLNHRGAIESLESLVFLIRKTVFEKTGREILIFEHGSASEHSKLSASSIEHLHLHIIYEPTGYDYINAVFEDAKSAQSPVIDVNRGAIKISSLQEFAQENQLRNRDYFMIWKPGASVSDSIIHVWLPVNQESQFLRRIFFQGLSNEEKIMLYGEAKDNKFADEYNWKIHNFTYSDERLKKHKEIGAAIQYGNKQD